MNKFLRYFYSNRILYFLLLFGFLVPASYINPQLVAFMNNVKLVACIIVIALYLLSLKYSKAVIFIAILQIIFVISTGLNPFGDLRNQFIQCGTIIGLCMLCEMGIRYGGWKALQTLVVSMDALALITIYTMFKYYPIGMYRDQLYDSKYFFMGLGNSSYFFFLPAIIMTVIYSLIKHHNINFFVYLFSILTIVAFNYIDSKSATISMIFLLILLIFYKNRVLKKFINYKFVMVFAILYFYLVVYLRIEIQMSSFVSDILHRNPNLTGRFHIWDRAFYFIQQKLLLGYGLEYIKVSILRFGINHVHNIFLDLLYSGGLLSLCIYAILMVLIGIKLYKYRSSPISSVITFGFFAFFIAAMMDYYNVSYFIFPLYIFAYNIEYLVKESGSVALKSELSSPVNVLKISCRIHSPL